MSEPASIPLPFANAPQQQPASEASPRPKILRRPSQAAPLHDHAAPVLPLSVPDIAPAAPAASSPGRARDWVDDGPFAIALLLIVIGVNLLTMIGLKRVEPTAQATTSIAATAVPIEASPAPTPRPLRATAIALPVPVYDDMPLRSRAMEP